MDLRGRMVMPGLHDGHLHPLDEWYAIQVGVTRSSRLGGRYPQYAGRLNAERGLPLKAVIGAASKVLLTMVGGKVVYRSR